jgi:hypothetical protein
VLAALAAVQIRALLVETAVTAFLAQLVLLAVVVAVVLGHQINRVLQADQVAVQQPMVLAVYDPEGLVHWAKAIAVQVTVALTPARTV